MTPLEWGMGLLLLGLVLSGMVLVRGISQIERLADLPPLAGPAPLVSLVVAARDEERNVEAAARSLLAQKYPALEIIAVDDRSTDRTGAILDELAIADPRLRAVHVRELPPGWLGKNHALAVGAAAAGGEWLLFADADIVMAPDAVSRAVAYAELKGFDHVTIMPDADMPSLVLQAFVCVGMAIFGLALRPWKARDPRSRNSVGVGAFNLVRARDYARVGGHERIRLRPDDDLKLGKILKLGGVRQDILSGRGMISVEWYRSIRETINGLMKNTFSTTEYNPLLMVAGFFGYLVMGLGPLLGLCFGSGLVRIFGAAAVATQLLTLLHVAREGGFPKRCVPLYPLIYVLYAWIVLRAMVLNLSQGGIVWRGTFYPLSELRKNRI